MKKQYDPKIYPLDGTQGKIYMGVPRERVLIPDFVDHRDAVLAALQDQGRAAGLFQSQGHRVDKNRDRIAEHFMELPTKPEWLHMIDSDMDHPPTSSLRLVRFGVPIIGALYFHRGESHDPFVFRRGPNAVDKYNRERKQWEPLRDLVYDWLTLHNVPMRDGSLVIDNCLGDPLLEVDAVATGSMMIHRSVFETMEPPWFEYRPLAHSEDLVFCDEAKFDYGIPVYADLSTIVGHYAWAPMGHAQFRQMHLARGVNVTTYSPADARKMLEEFLGISEQAAADLVHDATAHMVGEYWEARKPQSAEDVRAFYKDPFTGRKYLQELLAWNHTNTFDSLRRQLIPIRDKEVLEIGAGIGTVSMQLAVQRNEVVASETNDLLRDFIKHRWVDLSEKLWGHHGELYLVDQEWRDKEEIFDVAVALDVFEHIHAGDLPAMVQDIAKALKVGGTLHFHANWGQQDLYPMHYDNATLFDELLAEHGLLLTSPNSAKKVIS